MPTINVYYRESSYAPQLEEVTDPLKEYVAGQLTCSDITLDPGEVSVRPVYVALGKGMLADVELEVFAAPFPERVEKQDDICLNLRSFMLEHVEGLEDARAWLVLAELGHSVPAPTICYMRVIANELWEVLVPTHTNAGQEVPVEHHQRWDDEVRAIAGGLTIMRTTKGQWVDQQGELFSERMIPVRVACSEAQAMQIMEITLRHYGQKAVMAYLISERTLVLHQDEP